MKTKINNIPIYLAAFNKLNSQLEYYKEQSYKSYINSDQELNFDELQKLVDQNIIEMEKSIDEFIKDIYLIIETPQTMSIQLSVIKNNEGGEGIGVLEIIQDLPDFIPEQVGDKDFLGSFGLFTDKTNNGIPFTVYVMITFLKIDQVLQIGTPQEIGQKSQIHSPSLGFSLEIG